ncbi:MAG TPA: hypothetical protein VGJ04_05865 [Pirellulales bacterium]
MSVAFLRIFPVFVLGIALSSPLRAAAPFEELMQKVPEGANVLVVFNVEQILQSEFARSHDSQRKLADAFAQRSILIPPDATQFVMAAQYDLEHFTRMWEAAVMGLKTPLNFNRAALATGRTVEKLSGMEAIGGSKVFALKIGDKQLGLLSPSNRQLAARWAQRLKQNDHPLSEFLAQTGSYGDTAGTDIILAIDLTDVLPQKFVAERLKANEVLKGRNVDIDKLASILARVRGVRLGIKIGTKCNAMLVVDLQDDPASMADFAKPLLLSILGNSGVMLEEMTDWKAKIGKDTISLQGNLTDDGLRRLMGIVELPADSAAVIDPAVSAQASPGAKSGSNTGDSLTREASRKYFQSVQQRLDSLRLQKKDAKTLGQMAMWIDMAARGIDRMSMVNVDDDLLDYGAAMSGDLRQISASLQGVGIQSGAAQAQIYGDSYYYDDGNNVQGARRAVKAEAKAAGATSSLDLARSIANQTAAIRRKMTDRYKVDF